MLRWRLILGTVFVSAAAALFWWDHTTSPPGLVLLPLALILAVLASGELLWLLGSRQLRPLPGVVYAGNLLIVAASAASVYWPAAWGADPLGPLGWPLAVFALMVLAAFCGEMRRYEAPGAVMERLSAAVLALAYIGVLMAMLVQMRWLGDGQLGVPAIASLVLVVKLSDIGAYTCGRLFGRHKMAPVLSPGKTLEGAAGGLVFACLGAWLALVWLVPWMTPGSGPFPVWKWLGYGLVVGITGMFGDLAESLIKRDVGRKDSSHWMPGFGGVLDVLDSILFASPVALLYWTLLLARDATPMP